MTNIPYAKGRGVHGLRWVQKGVYGKDGCSVKWAVVIPARGQEREEREHGQLIVTEVVILSSAI